MACRRITFVALDGAVNILGTDYNIAKASQLLFPLLAGRAPIFEETLNWIKFAYTAYRTGAYLAPASTVFFPSTVSEGDTLFPKIWRHLLRRFSGS